ncbi:MAG: hypothetical protein AAF571_11995 [Verrucomicrobiota bacterium]
MSTTTEEEVRNLALSLRTLAVTLTLILATTSIRTAFAIPHHAALLRDLISNELPLLTLWIIKLTVPLQLISILIPIAVLVGTVKIKSHQRYMLLVSVSGFYMFLQGYLIQLALVKPFQAIIQELTG